MKQIKTIADKSQIGFDRQVNEALVNGWELVKRYYTPDFYFVAEMETEVITEEERCCENCKYFEQSSQSEPCLSCSEVADKWEPAT